MNYLAHSLLAGTHDPLFLTGNLIADHIKGKVALDALPERMRDGVLFHRLVDRETDAHPIFLRTCARFDVAYRRFSGVLTDIFYDHVLASEWDAWGGGEFAAHSTCVADCLDASKPHLPESFSPIADRIRSGVFFARYATREGIGQSLDRVASRLSRPTSLGQAITELDRLDAEIRADFAEFFPQLRSNLALFDSGPR
jgi:acyl carrier protein phosphodiesterase